MQGEVEVLDDIDPTQKGERLVVGNGELAELDLMRHGLEDHQYRASLPALTQSLGGFNPMACWSMSQDLLALNGVS